MWVLPAAAAAALGYAAYASAWPTAQRWGRGSWRLPGDAPELALTFDDGPSNETPRFLDLLDRLGAPATFFLCGANVRRRPGVAKSIVEAGHAVGNHSYSHPLLPLHSRSRVRQELERTQQAIATAAGRTPSLFRPPYGCRSPALRSLLPQLGLTSVHWTVMGRDWKWGAERIARHVVGAAGPGAILCLHDGDRTRPRADRAATLQALRTIVPSLADSGFRFVPLPARIGSGDAPPENRRERH